MLISRFHCPDISAEIEALEEDLQIRIPPSYRTFLEKYNGGETPETKFSIHRVSSDITGFYGFSAENESFDLADILSLPHAKMFLSDRLFPIAENCFGDYLLIGLADRADEVYFFYHDRPKRYIKLSDHFSDFIACCKSKKLGHCYTVEDRIALRKAAGNFEPPSAIALAEWQKEIDWFHQIHQEPVEL